MFRLAAALAALLLVAATGLVLAKSVELTDAGFDAALAGKNALVMFKAPWCGHCKAMTPAFDEVGAQFNADGSPVLIAHVDCTTQDALCQKHGVQGYPTLKVFESTGEVKPYEGGRDAQSLKAFVDANLKPKCSVSNPSEGCTDKEKTFIEKMKGVAKSEVATQLTRLENMKGSSMSPELKQWLFQRIAILKALSE